MGSLLPGWNERLPGVPPKGLEDNQYKGPQEQEGYFARLKKLKSARHQAEEGRGLMHCETTPLARHGSRILERSESGSMRSVLRRSSLPIDWRLRDPSERPAEAQQGLGSGSLPPSPARGRGGRASGRLDAYKVFRPREAHTEKFTWWNKVTSSALNQRPDEAEDIRRGPEPPIKLTDQQSMHYRVSAATGDLLEAGDQASTRETQGSAAVI